MVFIRCADSRQTPQHECTTYARTAITVTNLVRCGITNIGSGFFFCVLRTR